MTEQMSLEQTDPLAASASDLLYLLVEMQMCCLASLRFTPVKHIGGYHFPELPW